MRAAILTISDAGARGDRADGSGDAIASWLEDRGYTMAARALVPDDSVAIVRQLLAWCDGDAADLVLTTGGTGLSARDNTPEATRAVLERELPGFGEIMRMASYEKVKTAILSRATAGTRGQTLVVNLPGNPRAIGECLPLVLPAIVEAIDHLRGERLRLR